MGEAMGYGNRALSLPAVIWIGDVLRKKDHNSDMLTESIGKDVWTWYHSML